MDRRALNAWIGALPFILAGCASNPKYEAMKANLKRVPDRSEMLTVPIQLTYKVMGALGRVVEISLLPGTYYLEWQNDIGRFFAGEGQCVWWKLGEKFVLVPGGVWVPRDPADAPRFYRYMGTADVSGASLDEVLLKRTAPQLPSAAIDVSGVAINAIVNSPVRISPIAGGLAAGMAAGIIAGLSSDDHILVVGEPLSESVAALRAGIIFSR